MKKRSVILTLLTLFLIIFTACGNKEQVNESQEKTLTFANFRDIRDLNPHLYSGEMYAQNMLFESLIKINTDGSFKPWLAESWTISEDGKTYVFKLREDVSFSDGEKFNAEAAKANFEAVLSNGERHGWLESVRLMEEVIAKGEKAVEVTGEYELTVRLATAYYPFLVELGVIRPFRFISPKAFINGTTKDGVTALSGTGPYILKENHKDEYAVFEKNQNYWGEKPQIDKVIVKVIPDSQARAIALENGEIDMIYGSSMIDEEVFNKFKNLDGFKAEMSEAISTRMYLMNTTHKILKDINVRKAIQHAVDKNSISKSILNETESPADFVLSTNTPYANVGLKPYNFDLVEAERLLDESGWKKVENKKYREKNGEELVLSLNYNANNPIEKVLAQYMQGTLSKIGINLKIIGEEEQAYRDRMKAGNFEIVGNVSWGNPYEPHSFLGAMRSPLIYGDYAAQLGLKDKAEIDETILKALESTDETKRQEYYKFVITKLHDEAVYIPITYERNRVVYNEKIENLKFEISKYEIPVNTIKVK